LLARTAEETASIDEVSFRRRMTVPVNTPGATMPDEKKTELESPPVEPDAPDVLAIDVGGSRVKMLVNGDDERRRFPSGPKLTPEEMVAGVLERTHDWEFSVISVGVPAPVLDGHVVREPFNLGNGWVGFDFEAALGKPTKLVNDAAMQALGTYTGGRMLFLGLGTGLGSTLIVEGVIQPMELGHMPYRRNTYEDYVGERGLKHLGKKRWREAVHDVIDVFFAGLQIEYIVLGGGNASLLEELPPNVRLGRNEDAFLGGFRLWSTSARPAYALRTQP
jgi:polyphosphate glucokinase